MYSLLNAIKTAKLHRLHALAAIVGALLKRVLSHLDRHNAIIHPNEFEIDRKWLFSVSKMKSRS
jgi:hypothetical protein